ncbi:transcriptional initiation protein Tat [Hydrogenophilus thermoluteolus]|uniref:PhoX family protein n=1 Tax=Hydrogenophilus thermoluteolus TaxID=297 RepID=UPI0024A5C83B|nr:PhoX family phosphatase [Hydrogenophilus thermoluteolus]GLW60045.1 transcriptional initiation protein Tat [Hydrogenophilus thermoluteolus]
MKAYDEPLSNDSTNPTFHEIAACVMEKRRALLKGAVGSALLALFAPWTNAATARGTAAALPGAPQRVSNTSTLLAPFGPSIPTHSEDRVTVMPGFKIRAILPWGDPLTHPNAHFKPDGSNTAAEQAQQIGDNHDGMHLFPFPGKSDEGLLALNHEYTNLEYLYPADFLPQATLSEEKANKAIAAHGVSIIHLRRGPNSWDKVPESRYHRRITGATPCALTGPAAGHPLLQTQDDPSGRLVLGTLNNCAHGVTPWGTYLTCEENFNGYFGNGNPNDPMHKRYGIANGFGYRWHEAIPRFDVARTPNEPNRFGWVVEIDPFDPESTPKKRTALGRFKHENAAVTLAKDGRVVVYMGDDERFEYLYKFVSRKPFDPTNPEANRDLLDDGDLFVAEFTSNDTGNGRLLGRWHLLSRANPKIASDPRFPTDAEVLIFTRAAADVAGATKMDRPEWIAIHPTSGEVFVTLTNNSKRQADAVDAANPRAPNFWGQIVRWQEAGNDAAATEFAWDFFVIAGNPEVYPETDPRAGSINVTRENMFNSPDGLAFDRMGRLWIQTDGNYSNRGEFAGQGNNQMLVADPNTGEIRRFLVGPSGCEITGITFSPDGRTMFINIQHPGEAEGHPRAPGFPAEMLNTVLNQQPTLFSDWPHSQFPEITGGRPRSATLVIEREDGAPIFGAA